MTDTHDDDIHGKIKTIKLEVIHSYLSYDNMLTYILCIYIEHAH